MSQRKVLVTSALPYVNNVPHLGNLIGSTLSADVYARYCRLKNYQVLYVCGTDEYGTATETRALEDKISPQELCDKYHKLHRDIYEWFELSFDKFGRTTTELHTKLCQEIFSKLYRNGYIIEGNVEQYYCEKCSRFLADRYVIGTCPHCSRTAKGDQCESCTKLLSPDQLIGPSCKLCKSNPIKRTSDHLFLDLPKLQPSLEKWFTTVSSEWPVNVKQITQSWLNEGLKPRCITRDLQWGVPVPTEVLDEKIRHKYQGKVFYVWFDAPIGYLSITEDVANWWQNKDVKLVQFLGKDNIPFHSLLFPAYLLGTHVDYKLVDYLATTEYLNYEDAKFSKSEKTGIFGDNVMETGIPVEIWRYYLLSVRPETSDTVFQWKDLQAKTNNELSDNLGNFVNRVLKFLVDGTVPICGSLSDSDKQLIVDVDQLVTKYILALESVSLRDGLRIVMNISKLGNDFMQKQQPWKQSKERQDAIMYLLTNLTGLLATLLQPYMPSVSRKIFNQLNIAPVTHLNDKWTFIIPALHKISKPEPLFSKISDEQINQFKTLYGKK